MRLFLALAAAQSMGLFLPRSEAFVPASSWRGRSTATLGVGNWENDDFLDSLAGNNPGSGGGSDGDDLPSNSIDGAELSDEMKQKMKAEDETFGGGSRFKEMMEKAQQGNRGSAGQGLKNPFADNPYAGIEGLDPAAASPPPAAAAGLENLTVEQQAQMFRAMMQGQQAPPPIQQNVRPPKPDRKVGRNRDADAIQNTADVYFAQLKRDSTVRGIARIRGEDEKANAVFQDEKIEELKGLISQNPYLAARREEEQKLIETATEEMIAFQKAQELKTASRGSSQVSYKQKLAERRNKQRGGATAVAAEPPAPTKPVTEPKAVVPPVVEESPPAVEAASTPPEPVIKETPSAPPPQPVVAAQEPPQPAENPPSTQQSAPPVPSATAQLTTNSSPEEVRKGIRTLMGLILKHRGGPGFGAGGLKGQEIGQYEQLLKEVTNLLKEEARLNQAHGAGVDLKVEAQAAVSPPPVATAEAVTSPDTGGLATVPSSPTGQAQIESLLSCIEGAIMMYRNSPPELKEGVLMSIRSALLSAVNTCNNLMGTNEGIPTSASGAGTNADSMLACVEGAMLMYRNSPPELKQGVLMTLRAALLSALNTCNKIIAENDVANFQQYQDATAGMNVPPTSSPPKPTQFYDVVQVEEGEEEPELALQDDNSKMLETIYNKLESAAGNGKMGLREDLTSEEASDLADSLVEMRSIMMEELDTGIPQAPASVTATAIGAAAASSGSSTTSVYQKMLAQARAEKAANS